MKTMKTISYKTSDYKRFDSRRGVTLLIKGNKDGCRRVSMRTQNFGNYKNESIGDLM